MSVLCTLLQIKCYSLFFLILMLLSTWKSRSARFVQMFFVFFYLIDYFNGQLITHHKDIFMSGKNWGLKGKDFMTFMVLSELC